MALPFDIGVFFDRVDADIESVVSAAIAHVTPPAVAPASPPPASPPPASPPASPPARLERPARVQRSCHAQTRRRMRATLEWEAADETSSHCVAVAQQFDEAFEQEDLEDEDLEDGEQSGSDEGGTESDDDDDSYESSFVTDSSGSEDFGSDEEWTPQKKMCVQPDPRPFLQMEEFAASAGEAAARGAGEHSPSPLATPAAAIPAPGAAVLAPDAAAPAPGLLHAEELNSPAGFLHAEELNSPPGFLHAEELNSPPGFYNLWVL